MEGTTDQNSVFTKQSYKHVKIYIGEDDQSFFNDLVEKYRTLPYAQVYDRLDEEWVRTLFDSEKQLQLDTNVFYVFHFDVQGVDHIIDEILDPLRFSDKDNFLCIFFSTEDIPFGYKRDCDDDSGRFLIFDKAKRSPSAIEKGLTEIFDELDQLYIQPQITLTAPVYYTSGTVNALDWPTREQVYTYVIDSLYNSYFGKTFSIDSITTTVGCVLSPDPYPTVYLQGYDISVSLLENPASGRHVMISLQGQEHLYSLDRTALDGLDEPSFPNVLSQELVTAFRLTEWARQAPAVDGLTVGVGYFDQLEQQKFKEFYAVSLFEAYATTVEDLPTLQRAVEAHTSILQLKIDNVLYGFIGQPNEPGEESQWNWEYPVPVMLRGVSLLSESFTSLINYSLLNEFLPEVKPKKCFKVIGLWEERNGKKTFSHRITPVPDAAYQVRKNS